MAKPGPKVGSLRAKRLKWFLERIATVFVESNYLQKCWPWPGYIDENGYGRYGKKRAHQAAFELLIGAIPDGLELDHTCHDPKECSAGNKCLHRRCVNPLHLEPVSKKVNTLRGGSFAAKNAVKKNCPQGHPLSGENLKLDRYPSGKVLRRCRICANTAVARCTAKKNKLKDISR